MMRGIVKSPKDAAVLLLLAGGIVLPTIGFALFALGVQAAVLYNTIGVVAFVIFGLLTWLGIGVAGIMRALSIAFISTGVAVLALGVGGVGRRSPAFMVIAAALCLTVEVLCRFGFIFASRHKRMDRS
jgi:hypothetical protein